MKLARLGIDRTGVVAVNGDSAVPAAEVGQETLGTMAAICEKPRAIAAAVPLDQATILAPLARPPSICDFVASEAHARDSRPETWSEGELGDSYWSEFLAFASLDSRQVPGDVLGSGTVGSGCSLVLRSCGLSDTRHRLRPEDVVELEVDALGMPRNRIVSRDGVEETPAR